MATARNSFASLSGSFPPMLRLENLKGTRPSCVFKPCLDEKSLAETSYRIVRCCQKFFPSVRRKPL